MDSQVTPRASRSQNHLRRMSDTMIQTDSISYGPLSGTFPFRHDTNFTKDNLVDESSDDSSPGSQVARGRSALTWQHQRKQYRSSMVSTSYDDRHLHSSTCGSIGGGDRSERGYSPTRSVRSENGFGSHTLLRLPPSPHHTHLLSTSNSHVPEVSLDESGLSSFPSYDAASHRTPHTDSIFHRSASRHVAAATTGSLGGSVVGSTYRDIQDGPDDTGRPHTYITEREKGRSANYTTPTLHPTPSSYIRAHDIGRQVPLVYYRLGICVTVSDPLIPTTLSQVERLFSKYTVYPVTVRLLKPRVTGFVNTRPVSYTLYKRYSEFRALYIHLAREFHSEFKALPEFPAKVFLGRYHPHVVALRLRVFNELLTFVTLHPIYSKVPVVVTFLDPPCAT
ncbi:hypothetical protein BASA62_008594 [Batrachochytrium salamandrivorans]|nr:hypothetical protein BASA62_008594 [Batrachochytrium salamandrivorans]